MDADLLSDSICDALQSVGIDPETVEIVGVDEEFDSEFVEKISMSCTVVTDPPPSK